MLGHHSLSEQPISTATGILKIVVVTGITSGEAFGTATVANVPAQLIQPTGIPSAEAFGTHTVAIVTTIDREVSQVINTNFGSLSLYNNGNNYYTI